MLQDLSAVPNNLGMYKTLIVGNNLMSNCRGQTDSRRQAMSNLHVK